ncbi:glycine receptor subunit alpha-1 [Eurytemora carolleeae]|uniref:glycine receptor subunit alpha-1 n=1 Tax=Eurytemora carolleeae TaxID=1294199 RepID=UPI000C76853A|nr:glycine receptor subunit alpha-1 [Eurytemora carolleeae]|eukprot:XP_023327977.1 glycine receptor subunit alpha-1-like [Eurytemora affinis]
MYSQASQITFICPMIFNYFPLDTQVCKFQVGSYSYNMDKMVFQVSQLGYAHTSRSIVLDYDIRIKPLDEKDKVFQGGALGNFSLAGFEMILTRHVSHYIITYYLPSGLFVVVSWISFLVPTDVIPGIDFLPSSCRRDSRYRYTS